MGRQTAELISLAAVKKLQASRQAQAETFAWPDNGPTQAQLAEMVARVILSDPERFRGPPGTEPTADQLLAAVAKFLTPRLDVLRGTPGNTPDSAELTALIETVIRQNPDRFRGAPGDPGRGIRAVRINHAGHLLVTYTDGTLVNVGRVVGKDGEKSKENLFLGGSSGISEARALTLIEQAMSNSEPEEANFLRIVTTVTNAGPNTLHTPAAGKAIRVRRVKCTGDPDVIDSPMLTLLVGSKRIQRGPVLYGKEYYTGSEDAPLILELESAAKIGVNILYEEIDP